MNKKALLITSIATVFAVGIGAVTLSGLNQVNNVKLGAVEPTPVKRVVEFTGANVENAKYEPSDYCYYFDIVGETAVTHDEFRTEKDYCYLYIGSGNPSDATVGGDNIFTLTDTTGSYGYTQCYILFPFDDSYAEFSDAYAKRSAVDESPIHLVIDNDYWYKLSVSLPNNGTLTIYSITFEYYCK